MPVRPRAMPQAIRASPASASTISKRALTSLSHQVNFHQGTSGTRAGGASTLRNCGGNGVGARQ